MNEAGTLVFIHNPRRRSPSVRRLGLFRSFGPIRPISGSASLLPLRSSLLREADGRRIYALPRLQLHRSISTQRMNKHLGTMRSPPEVNEG